MYSLTEGFSPTFKQFRKRLEKIIFIPKSYKISSDTRSSVSGPDAAFHSHTAAGQLEVVVYYHRGTRLNTIKRFCLCSLCSDLSVSKKVPHCRGDAQKVKMRSYFSSNCIYILHLFAAYFAL